MLKEGNNRNKQESQKLQEYSFTKIHIPPFLLVSSLYNRNRTEKGKILGHGFGARHGSRTGRNGGTCSSSTGSSTGSSGTGSSRGGRGVGIAHLGVFVDVGVVILVRLAAALGFEILRLGAVVDDGGGAGGPLGTSHLDVHRAALGGGGGGGGGGGSGCDGFLVVVVIGRFKGRLVGSLFGAILVGIIFGVVSPGLLGREFGRCRVLGVPVCMVELQKWFKKEEGKRGESNRTYWH